jgi:hypothetical protein
MKQRDGGKEKIHEKERARKQNRNENGEESRREVNATMGSKSRKGHQNGERSSKTELSTLKKPTIKSDFRKSICPKRRAPVLKRRDNIRSQKCN